MSNSVLVNLSFLLSKPTGISTYAANLCPHLEPLKPTLLISPLTSELSPQISNYTRYPVPPNLTPEQGTKGHFRRLLWTQLKLPHIYQKLQSNLLFSPLPEAPLYSNCRYIVTVHDLIPLRFPQYFSSLKLYFRYYVPQVLSQAQHILCNSTATARDIHNFFKIPATKITPLLLAHDANHFRFLDLPSKEITEDCPYFLYIGRHDPYKNLKRLIDAFAAIDNYRDYELRIVGSIDQRYTPSLKAQADHLKLSHQVKFLDYLPYEQLPKIINQAIALVFPSLWEGFGFPALEAMACGTPVITSNLSSLPEVVGDAALMINPYKTSEITAAMQAIVTDPALRSRLRTLGLQQASQFRWEKTGKATVEVLHRYL
ncbi:MAG: glycosyltransferase family 4 protein [Symploca sp. SIO1C4]|uniref:Glycosyltransferase family 4 protein n=1 Tax=Symploca sp. SIO1C4 TaxID=2607765 RepID=A0A6B3N0E5_9CYAN|nr:glycosyltransferase family 4 protein [Symploca sp. SIO1C4]